MTSRRPRLHASSGFTLLEVVFVIVIFAVLTKYAMSNFGQPGHLTIREQAQSAADIVRRAQSLAMSEGRRLKVTASSTHVCIDAPSATVPCSGTHVFVTSQGVSVSTVETIYFNSLGQPIDSSGTVTTADSNFVLGLVNNGQTSSFTVTVASISGRVTVSP